MRLNALLECALTVEPSDQLAIASRRWDLDWLRLIAFGALIYFHAAVAFTPDGLPMILNEQPSPVLQWLVGFLSQFRLALLYLVSGVGVCFALRHRTRAAFLGERSRRLLIPLLFGIAVLVPPMVYLEKRFLGQVSGSLLQFYGSLFSEGVYPKGNLSWHHFWFVAYLWLFCVVGWPLLAWLRGPRGGAWLRQRCAWLVQGYRLYWLIVPLLLMEVPLRAVFPGFRDLIHDWASFSQWFAIFLVGFAFATNEPLLNRVQAIRATTLVLAVCTSAVLFSRYWSLEHGVTPAQGAGVSIGDYLLFCTVSVANIWFWLLVCLGYAGRYLNRPGPVLQYLNQAVYPLFCCHLTLLVAAEYLVLPLPWPISLKYLVITSAVILVNLLLYEYLIRRSRHLRPLFGLKPAT